MLTVLLSNGFDNKLLKQKYDNLKHLSKLIKRNPRNTDVLYQRGILYIQLKKFSEALSDFNQILVVEPKNDLVYCKMAELKIDLADYHSVISDLNIATEINPNNYSSYFNRGTAFKRLNCLDKALYDYTKTIELNTTYSPAFNNREI